MNKALIDGGTASISVSIDPGPLTPDADGLGNNLVVTVRFGRASIIRTLYISSDGDTLRLDGQPITSPPPALTALATFLATFSTKRDAALGAPGLVALLTS